MQCSLRWSIVFGALLVVVLAGCATGSSTPDGDCNCDSAVAEASEPTEPAERSEPVEPSEPVEAGGSFEPVVQTVEEATQRVAPNDQVSITWLARGDNAYVGRISLAPNAEVPSHNHPHSEEFLYILEGGGTLTIEDEQYELAAGTNAAIPVGDEHAYTNGPQTTVAVQVYAAPEAADRFEEWPEAAAQPWAADAEPGDETGTE